MFTLVKNGEAVAAIHVPAWAEAPELFAAEELAAYVKKISGAQPSINRGLTGLRGPAVIIADLSHPATPKLLPAGLGSPLKHDGFRIKVQGQKLYIVSRQASGVVAGVYGYLRAACGCAFLDLGETGELIPARADIAHRDDLDVIDNPAFWMRGMHFSLDKPVSQEGGAPAAETMARLGWMAKNGFNHALFMREDALLDRMIPELNKRGIQLEFGHHMLARLNPAEAYFKERPDFFPFQAGRHHARTQIPICPCNPEAVRSVCRNVERVLEAHPAIALLDLWAEESRGPLCECAACRKLADPADNRPADRKWLYDGSFDRGGEEGRRYGNRAKMRQYIHLVNQVAAAVGQRFPKVKFSILAYAEVMNPPAGKIELHPNVYVCLALYWRSMSHHIDDPASPINRQFMNIIREWLAVLDRPEKLYFYTYEMGMWGWWSLPYPALTDLFHDWEIFKKLGVGGDTIQSTSRHYAVYGLNYLMVGSVLREKHPSLNEFIRGYCRDYYGAAAGPMERLIREMEANFGRKQRVQVRPKPWLDIRRAFSQKNAAQWKNLLDQALHLAEHPVVRWRVERVRTLVNYVELWLQAPCDIHLKKLAWEAPVDPGEFLWKSKRRPLTPREQAAYDHWLQRFRHFVHAGYLANQDIFNADLARQKIY